jgi:hypothetical protein
MKYLTARAWNIFSQDSTLVFDSKAIVWNSFSQDSANSDDYFALVNSVTSLVAFICLWIKFLRIKNIFSENVKMWHDQHKISATLVFDSKAIVWNSFSQDSANSDDYFALSWLSFNDWPWDGRNIDWNIRVRILTENISCSCCQKLKLVIFYRGKRFKSEIWLVANYRYYFICPILCRT